MTATQLSLSGNLVTRTTTHSANKVSAQPAKTSKKPFALFTALNHASKWLSQSRTTWSTAGQTLN